MAPRSARRRRGATAMADEETQETVAVGLSPQAPSSAGSSRSEQSEHVTKHARTDERPSFASRLEASATAADEAEEANEALLDAGFLFGDGIFEGIRVTHYPTEPEWGPSKQTMHSS